MLVFFLALFFSNNQKRGTCFLLPWNFCRLLLTKNNLLCGSYSHTNPPWGTPVFQLFQKLKPTINPVPCKWKGFMDNLICCRKPPVASPLLNPWLSVCPPAENHVWFPDWQATSPQQNGDLRGSGGISVSLSSLRGLPYVEENGKCDLMWKIKNRGIQNGLKDLPSEPLQFLWQVRCPWRIHYRLNWKGD